MLVWIWNKLTQTTNLNCQIFIKIGLVTNKLFNNFTYRHIARGNFYYFISFLNDKLNLDQHFLLYNYGNTFFLLSNNKCIKKNSLFYFLNFD